MLNRIIKRVRNHNDFVSRHRKGEISNEEFENFLIDEIEYLERDLEEKLNEKLLEEEKRLLKTITIIRKIIEENDIEKSELINLIHSEFNSLYLKKYIL